MKSRTPVHAFLAVLVLAALWCSLPVAVKAPVPPPASTSDLGVPPPAPSASIPAAAGTETPAPPVATVMTIQHTATPSDVSAGGKINYDVDSSTTGPEHRAPYGDSYNINLFERPFTKLEMNYRPELDILTFQLTEDTQWYYVSFDLAGGDLNDPSLPSYGVELDTDHDGFGDFLIWATPPYTTQWLAESVQVYKDSNHDTGGASAEKSDAVYPGDGYDTLIFDRGQGADIDLAFVRLNPQVTAAIQFAFKRSLAGNAFMWGVWADSGLKDPGQFNYNDRFKEEDAGSPEKSEKHYPINAIFQVDNTCWLVVGFKATGYEAHLCPTTAPPATRRPRTPEAPTTEPVVPNIRCLPPGTLIDSPKGLIPVEELRLGDAVWSATENGSRTLARVIELAHVAVPPEHPVVHVVLADGREVWASPGHPTADRRTFGELATGTYLDGALISLVEVLNVHGDATYDLLPSGPTGYYWANGVLIGSTLRQ